MGDFEARSLLSSRRSWANSSAEDLRDDEAPDYIMLRNVAVIQAANGLGIAECVRQAGKANMLEIVPFEAAIQPVPTAADPTTRSPRQTQYKWRHHEDSGSEDDEPADCQKLNPLAGWLLFDKALQATSRKDPQPDPRQGHQDPGPAPSPFPSTSRRRG